MQAGGSQQRVTLSHRKQWATYEDSFACHYWHLWAEVRDIVQHPTVHRKAPTTKEILAPVSTVPGLRNCSFMR